MTTWQNWLRRVVSVTSCHERDARPGLTTHRRRPVLLQRALRLRNPYVDVLNLLQAELLQRKRSIAALAPPAPVADDEALDDALLVTINGIAAGMQKSG